MEEEKDKEEIVADVEKKQKKEERIKKLKRVLKIEAAILGSMFLILIIGVIMLTMNSTGDVVKPIIYLYPEETTEISVKLGNPHLITCSYPEYENKWSVVADPDGTLTDKETGRTLYSLYWEGEGIVEYDLKEGFCVKGEDIVKFLEEKLEILGLSEKEAEEFIIYWLPRMQNNKYNYIRFATMEQINEYMPLEFSKEPDTIIRVLMQYKPLDAYVEVKEQELETPERKGFVVVEWGGTELK